MLVLSCVVSGRHAVGIANVLSRPRFQQQLHHPRIPKIGDGGVHQGRPPLVTRAIDVGAALDQQAGRLDLMVLHRENERVIAVRLLPVHLRAQVEERAHHGCVAPRGGELEWHDGKGAEHHGRAVRIVTGAPPSIAAPGLAYRRPIAQPMATPAPAPPAVIPHVIAPGGQEYSHTLCST